MANLRKIFRFEQVMNNILNFSGVFNDENWLPEGLSYFDFRTLEGCSCYCSPESESIIRKAVTKCGKAGVCWIDTGDYHYISLFRIELLKEPFLLALFDNHPDDEPDSLSSGLLSCGNWVKQARERISLMKGDYRNSDSLPGTLPVFLSIDLDVLSRVFARTDWTHGDMSVTTLLSSIDKIRETHPIAGVDICGGLTVAKGARAEDLSINAGTRSLLYSYFQSHPPVSG